MQVGIMSPTKNRGSSARPERSAESESFTCERAAFANTIPSPTSAASAIMRLRRVASTIVGSSPMRWAPRSPPTNARMSPSGGPAFTPMRSSAGPCETPMPKAKRPPECSWMNAAVCA